MREGKHGARFTKQAIAIGRSKARRAGVRISRKGKSTKRGQTKGPARRSAAARKAARTRARRS